MCPPEIKAAEKTAIVKNKSGADYTKLHELRVNIRAAKVCNLQRE